MPRRRAAWASWNYHLTDRPTGRTTVTYDMNRLQSLDADRDFLVTLNRTEAIDPATVIRTIDYAHPVFTPEGVAAQRRWAEISGRGGPTTAAPTGAGAFTRTASGRRCGSPRGSAAAGRWPQPGGPRGSAALAEAAPSELAEAA